MRSVGVRAGLGAAGLPNPQPPRKGSAGDALGGLVALAAVVLALPSAAQLVLGVLVAVLLLLALGGA